jgi:IS5 family transposase
MQNSLFDLENRYASLFEAGAPLERLDAVIDWEIFRPILQRIDAKHRKSAAGRKPTCRVLMFKLLILQRLHGLSDERLQYQVTDRLSFMRFLRLDLASDVPDARTVWAFRELLKAHRLVEPLFERLNQALADLGVELKSGQIIDATFVPVPIQRNGREDNALIKMDAVPIEWGQNKARLAHKDIDARWTKKGGQSHYGYKNHLNIERATQLITQLITRHACTDASVRARPEHVFGAMENSMGGIFLCSIGAPRAQVGVGLMNLAYNLKRIEVLIRHKVFTFDTIGAPRMQRMA